MGCNKFANVLIPRPIEFEEKKRALIQGGFENLQVVSDFDKTLTPHIVNGKAVATSFGRRFLNVDVNNLLNHD